MTRRTHKRKRKVTVGSTWRTKQVNTILQTVAGRTQEEAQNTLDINPLRAMMQISAPSLCTPDRSKHNHLSRHVLKISHSSPMHHGDKR
jgi:hypothetical protein